jgi:hypothetical protein
MDVEDLKRKYFDYIKIFFSENIHSKVTAIKISFKITEEIV